MRSGLGAQVYRCGNEQLISVFVSSIGFWFLVGPGIIGLGAYEVTLPIPGKVLFFVGLTYVWARAGYWWTLRRERMVSQPLVLEFASEGDQVAHRYCIVSTHPETNCTTTLYRVSVRGAVQGAMGQGRLLLEALTNRLGHPVLTEPRALRSAATTERRDGRIELNFDDRAFFDVVAYYKHEPKEFFVCLADGGLRVPASDAHYIATIQLTGTGPAQRKRYRFDLNQDGDPTFRDEELDHEPP